MSQLVDPVRADLRLSGEVIRYHTWPHIRQTSVGEHSWQLARIALCVWPSLPRSILVYIQFHDAGEHWAGDIPYPVKGQNPVLKAEMDRLEEQALGWLLQMWDININTLTAEEKVFVKLCELIEAWEWAEAEVRRGNRFAQIVATRCREAFDVKVVQETEAGRLSDTLLESFKKYILIRDELLGAI